VAGLGRALEALEHLGKDSTAVTSTAAALAAVAVAQALSPQLAQAGLVLRLQLLEPL
jgi:hypothetical protein